MSDILIKGMEMPKDGEMLCVNIYPDGKVCINLDLECKRIATAVPVPPHGRCIDENALLKGCGYIIADGMACIPVKHIANAPTILEAEEGE